MRSTVSVKIKITATPELIETISIYSNGLQFCIDTAWENKIRNNIKLHPFVYPTLKNYGLQSQLCIACIKQACGMIKKAKSKPIVNRTSVRYNFPRSASFKGNVLSIATIKGRQKFPFTIPDCYKQYFAWEVAESLVRIDRKGRAFFIFTFSKDINIGDSASQKIVLGVDVGVNNLAVCSDGKVFKSAKTKIIQFRYLRDKLQAKGTKSAKRLLRKRTGRQRRFMTWVNHNVSKTIVGSADTIVLENLKGIRKSRNKYMGKRLNRWLNNWSFYELQQFIRYKAEMVGKSVIYVNPYLTSQICSSCGTLGSRYGDSFFCCHCGFSAQSDFNASCNLRRLAVTKPYGSCDDVKGLLASATELSAKSPTL